MAVPRDQIAATTRATSRRGVMTAAPTTKNATSHGIAVPDVTDGADGTNPHEEEPVMTTIEHNADNNQITPIAPAKPVKFKTEKQLAVYLAKIYGEVPVFGGDLASVFDAATDDYYTEAEQRACIEAAVERLLPDPEPAAKNPAVAEWDERRDRQSRINILPVRTNGTRALDEIGLTPRPDWSNPDRDYLSTRPEISAFQSDILIATRLSRFHGVYDDRGAVKPAYIRMNVTQFLGDREPVIEMLRMECSEDRASIVPNPGSRTQMTAQEATALAHSLLAAVDLIEATK